MSEKVVIEPKRGLRLINVQELVEYRDLYYFFVWRSIKSKYAQSILGIGWAVIQPVTQMLIFTLVFGKGLKIDSQGVPYALFVFSALVPWNYFSNALNEAVGGLNANKGMLSKIYFPRLIIPMTSVLSRLLDFFIAFVFFVLLMLYYGHLPTINVVYFPLLVLIIMLTASGAGMLLSALAIQYRDIQYAMGLMTQLLMWTSPIVYPISTVPEKWQTWYALNPMVGVIEASRSMFLGTGPMPWVFLAQSGAVALILTVIGVFYFRHKERVFADVA